MQTMLKRELERIRNMIHDLRIQRERERQKNMATVEILQNEISKTIKNRADTKRNMEAKYRNSLEHERQAIEQLKNEHSTIIQNKRISMASEINLLKEKIKLVDEQLAEFDDRKGNIVNDGIEKLSNLIADKKHSIF